jgi:hypothetical protein
MLHHKIHKFQEHTYDFVMGVTYFLYFLIALGLSTTAPKYLSHLDYYVKLYVSIFLIYRFNPFRHVKFTELDRKIAFSAGIFVFTTAALTPFYISNPI